MSYGFKLLAWFIVPATFAVAIYMVFSCIYDCLKPYCDGKIWPLSRGKREKSAEVDTTTSTPKAMNKGWATDGTVPIEADGRV